LKTQDLQGSSKNVFVLPREIRKEVRPILSKVGNNYHNQYGVLMELLTNIVKIGVTLHDMLKIRATTKIRQGVQ
jgi:hypothetical protein